MNTGTFRTVLTATVCTLTIAAPAAASGRDRGVVQEWNQLLQATMPGNASIQAPRYLAMMHIAMFDAANSAEPTFNPYRLRVREGAGALPEVAAAQAAHDVLVALFPASTSVYDAALTARFATLAPSKLPAGIALGKRVAAEILAWRANDGWSAPEPGYALPPFPGLWQVTPGSTAATFTRMPGVKPFALLTATQHLPPSPPTLTNERYTEDFNEVKEIGSASSAVRTTDQTRAAQLWAGGAAVTSTNLFAVWSNVTRDASNHAGLSLVATARLFALVFASIHDGLLTTQTSKFVFGLWRPVTAIRRADEDLNPLTSPDPNWVPLLTTPSYPAYAGNQACVGASAATVLASVLGTNDAAVTIEWKAPDGVSVAGRRYYAGFWQAAQEQERSRVWGGIHYSFDGEASQVVCPKVANWVLSNHAASR
jgi:hypothetical protein